MSLFLSQDERAGIAFSMDSSSFRNQWVALRSRVRHRSMGPGLPSQGITTAWWYQVAEFLSDAALIWAIEDAEGHHDEGGSDLALWIRSTTLSIVRRSEEDWVGPYYRDHVLEPRVGHLETAHLSIGVAIVLDLASALFSSSERDEIVSVLCNRAIPLCERWLDYAQRLNNWRCILAAGLTVAAAVVGDATRLRRGREEFLLCGELFQSDGSYAESLQYGNYAAWGLMMSYEALTRSGQGDGLSIKAYEKKVVWDLYSFLYMKPLAGWGQYPRARAVNFNDSAAMYRASGDVLAHIAARTCDGELAATSRLLYERWYGTEARPNAGPFDLATFGLFNAVGFLTFIHFSAFPPPIEPDVAGYPLLAAFENGDVFVRNGWNGHTTLAMRAGGSLLNGPSHLHGDMNSFVLVHARERMLIDPGHSCYRNVTRSIEVDTRVHNTCVFHPVLKDQDADQRQEDLFKSRVVGQGVEFTRSFAHGRPGPPVDRGTRMMMLEQYGDSPHERISAIAADSAAVYGDPVEQFTRIWLLIGEKLLIVCDRFTFSRPCRIEWNWSLNNRDGALEFDIMSPWQLCARRGSAGIRVVHMSDQSAFMGPLYSVMHDHYHPEPAQHGEGRPGSACLFRWTSSPCAEGGSFVHAFLMDSARDIELWSAATDDGALLIREPNGRSEYVVRVENTDALRLTMQSRGERHCTCTIASTTDGRYRLTVADQK